MIFLKKCSALDPMDTGQKLNVLCTFNLRPVSTGRQVISVAYFVELSLHSYHN